MKTPGLSELQTIVEYLSEELLGSQIQEILTTEEGLVLSLYRFHLEPKMKYLVFDLDRPFPFIGLFDQSPWKALKKSKPLGLFLNAHAKNTKISSIKLLPELGRVVEIITGTDARAQDVYVRLEARMIPRQGNLLVQVIEKNKITKSISWDKVIDLQPLAASTESEERSIPFMMKQWFERRGKVGGSAGVSVPSAENPYQKWLKQKEKDRQKKIKALETVQKQIHDFQDTEWALVGDHLKTYGFQKVKPEWSLYLDFEKSVSQNIQKCFEKMKQNESKMKGALERVKVITDELQGLEDLSEQRFLREAQSKMAQRQKTTQRKVEGRFRKLNLPIEGLDCWMGKSAKDNLDLLRQSKSWDFWMHLKDYPSAHAILQRRKDQNVSTETLNKCGQWLIKEGLGDKVMKQGGKLAIVVVECRHVRPIKGDKLGRVTYHNAREILIAF